MPIFLGDPVWFGHVLCTCTLGWGSKMTKSKKQRTSEAQSDEDVKKLLLLVVSVATVIVVLYVMAG